MNWLKGAPVCQALTQRLLTLSRSFLKSSGVRPFLVIVRVGHDPASVIYVKAKRDKALSLGFEFKECHFDSAIKEEELSEAIQRLNKDDRVHGILVQCPLPDHLNADRLTSLVVPEKDVDGLHPLNQGLLMRKNSQGFVPCTPWGCLELLKFYGVEVAHKQVVVMGRSRLVGLPLALLLLRENASVMCVHSFSRDVKKLTRLADIVCVAIGRVEHVDADYFNPKAYVVDIGIHRKNGCVVGDVCHASVEGKIAGLSPVPGGVGPLTVMGLMHNTLKAAFQQCGRSFQW